MRLRSAAFDAKVKAVGVKPDGVEVKLTIEGLDGSLLQELAGMMALGTVDVTLAAKVEQPALPFDSHVAVETAPDRVMTLNEYLASIGGRGQAAGAEVADRGAGEAGASEQTEATPNEPPAPEDPAGGAAETAENGAATDEDLWERENVGWILRNSVGDINYKTAVPRLTDEELRYCLRCEHRKSGQQQLLAEARRRGLAIDIVSLRQYRGPVAPQAQEEPPAAEADEDDAPREQPARATFF